MPTSYEIAAKQYLIDVRGTYDSLFGEGEGKIPDRKADNNLQELFAERREKNRLRKMIETGDLTSDEEIEEYVNRNPYSGNN